MLAEAEIVVATTLPVRLPVRVVADTFPVKLPDRLVVEMKLVLIVVAPAVFCTTTCGAVTIVELPTLTRLAFCRETAELLLRLTAEVLMRTLAPTVTLSEAEIVVATTLPVRLPLMVVAITLPRCTPEVLPVSAVADITTLDVELPTVMSTLDSQVLVALM